MLKIYSFLDVESLLTLGSVDKFFEDFLVTFHDWCNVDCSSLHFFDPYLFNMIRPHSKTVKSFKMRGGYFGTNLVYPLTLMNTISHFTNLCVLVLKRNRYLLKLDVLAFMPKLKVLILVANYQIPSKEFAKHLPSVKCLTELNLDRNPQMHAEDLVEGIASLCSLVVLNIHGTPIRHNHFEQILDFCPNLTNFKYTGLNLVGDKEEWKRILSKRFSNISFDERYRKALL